MKLDKFKFLFVLILVLSFLSLFSSFSLAAEKELETEYPGIGEQEGLTGETTLPEYVKYVFQISLIIAAVAALAVLIYGGLVFLTSAGSPVAQNEAKNWIFGGILGLILLLSSYLILIVINPELKILEIPGLEEQEPSDSTTPSSPEIEKTIYQEMPIGTLVENLLAKNIDCYNYDDEGNMTDPPEGCGCAPPPEGSEGQGGVEMMADHDFFDCVERLDGALIIKIGKLIELAKELVALYAQCNCGKCHCSGSSSGSSSCAPCSGPDPCPRAAINAKIDEINYLVHGDGVTDPNYLYLDLGLKRIRRMRNLYREELNNLIAVEAMMKGKCQYGTPLNLVKFFDFREVNKYADKEKYEDVDIRKYCIEFNCIEWKYEDDPKKEFCTKYELNDKWRLCGATTTQTIVQATGKKDIKEYFVFDGDPATFYCSLIE